MVSSGLLFVRLQFNTSSPARESVRPIRTWPDTSNELRTTSTPTNKGSETCKTPKLLELTRVLATELLHINNCNPISQITIKFDRFSIPQLNWMQLTTVFCHDLHSVLSNHNWLTWLTCTPATATTCMPTIRYYSHSSRDWQLIHLCGRTNNIYLLIKSEFIDCRQFDRQL